MGFLIFLIVAAVVGCVLWRVSTENRLNKLVIKVEESASDIDVALLRRFDTLTKMRDICKQFATHERQTFSEVTAVRKGMTFTEMKNAERQLNTLADQISLVVEAYPELRSHEQFQQLNKAVWDIETQIQAARRIYNSNVSVYNTLVVNFPARIVAEKLGFVIKEFFEVEEKHKLKDVDMDMSL